MTTDLVKGKLRARKTLDKFFIPPLSYSKYVYVLVKSCI